MYVFVIFVLLRGCKRSLYKGRINNYWSKDFLLESNIPNPTEINHLINMRKDKIF